MLAASEHSLTAHPAVGLWMPSVGVPAHIPPASALHPSCIPPASFLHPPCAPDCVPATSVPLEAATRAVLDLGLCLGTKCHGAGGSASAPGEGLGGGNGYRAGAPPLRGRLEHLEVREVPLGRRCRAPCPRVVVTSPAASPPPGIIANHQLAVRTHQARRKRLQLRASPVSDSIKVTID